MSSFKAYFPQVPSKDSTTGLNNPELIPSGNVPANSTLDLSNPPPKSDMKWHYKGIVEIVRALEQQSAWQNFTTLDLTGAILADTSLGKNTVAVSKGGDDYVNGAQTLKDLFASSHCKITTLIMNGVAYHSSPDNKEDFTHVLAEMLSGSYAPKTVYIDGTSPPLDKNTLQGKCPHISFK